MFSDPAWNFWKYPKNKGLKPCFELALTIDTFGPFKHIKSIKSKSFKKISPKVKKKIHLPNCLDHMLFIYVSAQSEYWGHTAHAVHSHSTAADRSHFICRWAQDTYAPSQSDQHGWSIDSGLHCHQWDDQWSHQRSCQGHCWKMLAMLCQQGCHGCDHSQHLVHALSHWDSEVWCGVGPNEIVVKGLLGHSISNLAIKVVQSVVGKFCISKGHMQTFK